MRPTRSHTAAAILLTCASVALAQPATTKPASTQPAATRPATPKPAATKPVVATKPAAAKPASPPQPPPKPVLPPKPTPPSQPQQAVSSDLAARVNQRRDPAKRQAALDEIDAMLNAAEPARQIEALRALSSVADVNLDHDAFSPALHRLILSPDAGVRVAALTVLPSYGGQADDLPTLVKLADDPSPEVRIAVPRTYVAINGRVTDLAFDALLLKLLADPEVRVQRGALAAMANVPTGPAVEARLIAMARDEAVRKERSLIRDVIVLGLSTRPTIRVPVAQCLIDLLMDAPLEPDFPTRICWAFRSNEVVPEAQDQVVSAVVVAFKDSLNDGLRDHCIAALARIKTDAALTALEDIASDPDEQDRVRQAAQRALATP